MGFAAEKYGADCVGVTVSPDQAAYGRERYKDLPIEFQVKDYREFDGKVDKIVSMGMFEHVGYKNYRTYFETARRALKGDGLFMLHTIGQHFSETTIEPWLEKYIFPGGVIPSIAQIGKAIDGLWTVIDVHNIGPHYDKTLVRLERELRSQMDPAEHARGRPLLPHVAVLPALLRRRLPARRSCRSGSSC